MLFLLTPIMLASPTSDNLRALDVNGQVLLLRNLDWIGTDLRKK